MRETLKKAAEKPTALTVLKVLIKPMESKSDWHQSTLQKRYPKILLDKRFMLLINVWKHKALVISYY